MHGQIFGLRLLGRHQEAARAAGEVAAATGREVEGRELRLLSGRWWRLVGLEDGKKNFFVNLEGLRSWK